MNLFKYVDLIKENNTLRLEKEELENLIKSELFISLKSSVNENEKIKKLIEENKQLRQTIKKLRNDYKNKETK